MSSAKKFEYRVDGDDRIAEVSSSWLAFAQENGAHELTEASIVGHDLWDFISGEEAIELYRKIHARVRGRDQVVVIPFRCDSPTIRRDMQLIVSGDTDDDYVHYTSNIVRASTQPYLALLDSTRIRQDARLWMCSCCKKVLLEPDGWIDIEEFSDRIQLNARRILPQCHHTLCSTCGKLFFESNN